MANPAGKQVRRAWYGLFPEYFPGHYPPRNSRLGHFLKNFTPTRLIVEYPEHRLLYRVYGLELMTILRKGH
jgi:hypothetical protein